MTKKALGIRVNCGSFSLDLGNVLGGWPASRLLAREDSRVFSLSRAFVVARAWPCGRRNFGNEKEMRRECEGGEGGGVIGEEPVVLKNQKEREEELILVMSKMGIVDDDIEEQEESV